LPNYQRRQGNCLSPFQPKTVNNHGAAHLRMKIQNSSLHGRSAFTLIEVAITTAILGVIFVTFYAGIGAGFSMVSLSRENLRANQILLDKMETVRLYSWSQINSNGFIPPTFTVRFDPAGGTNGSGVTYHGELTVGEAPIPANYATNLKLVTVSLTWTNGNNARVRSMQTLVSEFGLQTYIY
jgi:prepilin-type N-terminal cleavage/methylation domain-containing protein